MLCNMVIKKTKTKQSSKNAFQKYNEMELVTLLDIKQRVGRYLLLLLKGKIRKDTP